MLLKKLTALVCAALLLLPLAACDKSKVAKAIKDASVATNQLAKANDDLYAAQLVDAPTHVEIAKVLLEATHAQEEIRLIVRASGGVTPDNKAAILDQIDRALGAFDRLNQLGVLHLKSQEAQAAFAVAITTGRTAIISLKVFVAEVKKPVKTEVK